MADTNALIGTQLKTFPGGYFGNTTYTWTFSDSTDAIITLFQCEEACDLTGAMAFCNSIQGTSPFYKFELFAVDTSAYFTPTGSALATTAGFQVATATDESANFTSAYTCTQGQVLCLKLSYADDGSTIDGSNYAVFKYASAIVRYNLFPMVATWNGSSWSADNKYYPSMVVHSDLAAGVDFGGIYNIGSGNYESITTAGDRYALRMEIPASENLELHVDGFRYTGKVESSGGGDVIVGIWPATGSALASATIDSYQQKQQMDKNYSRDYYFTSTATVLAGDVVYLGFEHTGGGAGDNLNISYTQPNGAAGLKSWPGGASFYASKYASASWTDDNTKRLMLNPILSSVHGTGGGGSTTRPTMGVIG